MKSNRFWLFLLGGIIFCSSVVMLFLWQTPAGYSRIYKDGVLVTDAVNLQTLSEPFTIIIDGAVNTGGTGGLNIVEADHGRIRMLEADCLDGFCVRQGWVSGGFVPIVCLPNRVVITFEGGADDMGVDAVVG